MIAHGGWQSDLMCLLVPSACSDNSETPCNKYNHMGAFSKLKPHRGTVCKCSG